MFIPDIFIRGMDAICYSSGCGCCRESISLTGVEFIVLVDYNYTDKAYKELQIAIDAYYDGHYETRKEAIEEYMNPIGCAYMVFYNSETPYIFWNDFCKEVILQCPIVKILET